jgi:hypothetical protein
MANAISPSPQAQNQINPIVQQMLQQGTSTAPTQTPITAMARVGQGALGAYTANLQEQQRQKQQAARGTDMAYLANAVQPWTDPDTGQQSQGGMEGLLAAMNSGRLQTPEAQDMVAQALLAQSLKAKGGDPFTLGPGQVRYGPNGQVVAEGPAKQPDSPSSYREWMLAQQDPAYAAYLKAQAERKGTKVSQTTVLPKAESEREKAIGKDEGTQYSDFVKAAQRAGRTKHGLSRMRNLMTQVRTGAGAGVVQGVKRFAKGMGIDLESIGVTDTTGPAEAIQSLAMELVRPMMEATKGSITEREMAMFLDSVPGLLRTEKGNALIIETMEAFANRTQQIGQMARDARRNKGSNENWVLDLQDNLAQFDQQNSLFGDEWKARHAAALEASQSEGPRITPASVPETATDWKDPKTGIKWKMWTGPNGEQMGVQVK